MHLRLLSIYTIDLMLLCSALWVPSKNLPRDVEEGFCLLGLFENFSLVFDFQSITTSDQPQKQDLGKRNVENERKSDVSSRMVTHILVRPTQGESVGKQTPV